MDHVYIPLGIYVLVPFWIFEPLLHIPLLVYYIQKMLPISSTRTQVT